MDEFDWRSLTDEYGPYAILAAVFAFMFWIRARPAVVDRVIQSDVVFFSSGNDPWYHARIVHHTVKHFPATPEFDPWSYFPYGTGRHSGFGGLFDQLIALVALIAGGGDPSPHLIDIVIAYAPAVFGAVTVIPVYLIARRLVGRWSGLIVAGLLALASGQFLSRTIIGSADHQSAEAFFGALAVVGFLYAVQVAYREQPTTADIQDRNWIVLRRPVTASLLGGVAVASYLMMWPPGAMIVFTFGIFTTLQLVRDHLDDRSLEYLTFGVAVSMLSTGILTLLYAKSYSLSATAFSLLQPLIAIGIAAGAVVMFALSRYMREEGYERSYYPIAVTVLIAGSLAVAAVVYPKSIALLQKLFIRIYSFGLLTSPSSLTVAEIQPANLQDAWRAFGPIFYVAVVGMVLMLVRVIRGNRPVEFLVLLWSLTIFSAYFTMIRFGYYMAVNVALLAGFAIWWTGHHLLQLDTSVTDLSTLEAYQIIGVIVILIAVVPGNVVAVQDRQPVWEQSDRFGGTDRAWHNELTWMNENTPEEPLSYDERYAPPQDGDFDYPAGAYGVMSWWDYGHWITFQAQRIPNANPFQQGPREASAYFQAQSEERANLILEALPSLQDRTGEVPDLSNEELRSIIANQNEQKVGEDTRYVVIDDQMAAGKFAAIATWTGPGYGSYLSQQEFRVGLQQQQTARLVGLNDRYRNMMLARLYFQDARNLSHYRLVHETSAVSSFVSVAQQRPNGFRSTNIINRRVTPRLLNLVQQRSDLFFYDIRQASRVKTFERVEGAKLTGRVDTSNRTTVSAFVRLQTNTGRNFTYVKRTQTDETGAFTLTVPYATTEEIGPSDGGTNSSVIAKGNYTVIAGFALQPMASGTADVPESAIYEGETIQVELQSETVGNETGGQSGGGSAPDIDTPRLEASGSASGTQDPPTLPQTATSVRGVDPIRAVPADIGT